MERSKSIEEEINTVQRAGRILEVLKNSFSIPDLSDIVKDPFKVLVRTIISQSTSEKNTQKAFENLSAKIPVTPKSLAEADVRFIEESLRCAGLYRNKSIVIKEMSKIIVEVFGGSLNFIYSLPLSEAREKLMSLPGVGPKTADIVLLFCAGKPVLPVDTHVQRVSKRLGLVPKNERKYDSIRARIEELYPPEYYFHVHMLFIALGRRFCKSRRPRCPQCVVNDLCPSANLQESIFY
ncbi:MAG: endonuclease III [Candidatus Bathyarchaeota archaeon]|nr:endonuclease III [Candidatus Bathyarchaeota archaeon]